MVRIVQVSDTHLSRRSPEATANWNAIVDHLTADPPDLVINTGDVSLDGVNDVDDLEFASRAHQALTVPWRTIPGNHDVGDIGEGTAVAGAAGRSRYVDAFGEVFWSLSCGAWDVVGVDIQALASAAHDVDELWAWLGEALATTRPVMLCMHRPLMPLSADETDDPRRYVTADPRARLRSLIDASTVRVVATGHVHQSRRVEVDGRAHVWAPSTWATLPDAVQPIIGTKVVGIVEHRLGSDATTSTVIPEGVHQHVIGVTIPSPYSH